MPLQGHCVVYNQMLVLFSIKELIYSDGAHSTGRLPAWIYFWSERVSVCCRPQDNSLEEVYCGTCGSFWEEHAHFLIISSLHWVQLEIIKKKAFYQAILKKKEEADIDESVYIVSHPC